MTYLVLLSLKNTKIDILDHTKFGIYKTIKISQKNQLACSPQLNDSKLIKAKLIKKEKNNAREIVAIWMARMVYIDFSIVLYCHTIILHQRDKHLQISNKLVGS